MIIGIDGNEANLVSRVGVNQYSLELLTAIRKLEDEWKGKHKIIVFLREKPKEFLPKATKNFTYKVISGRGAWIIRRLSPELFVGRPRPDVFFSPSHYVPPFPAVPVVCTIHDLGYLEFSEQFKKYDFWQLKYWSAYSIFVSKAIIAVSTSTRNDIVRHYPFASKKIHVVHHGYDSSRFNQSIDNDDVRRIKEKYSIVKDYVLYLSTLKPSKNVEGLLTAWKQLKKEYPNYCLVVAGKKGWLYGSIFEKVQALGLTKDIIFTDYVPEEEKPALIRGARVFTLPSFWEGFGMDVLHAFACGVPVVASNKGALPEVVGDAGILVDPYDTSSIAAGIKKVLSASERQYNNLVNKGLTRVKDFSWEKTARKTLSVLEGVQK